MRHTAILAAILVAACSGGGETSRLVEGKEAVKALLRDPGSADFQRLRTSQMSGRTVVCGEVNATNGFGGKVGYRRFVSDGGAATVIDDGGADFSAIWTASGC